MDLLIDLIAVFIVAAACYLLTGAFARADESIQVLGPIAITQHIVNDPAISRQFSNRLSADGSTIANPEIGVIFTTANRHDFESVATFIGSNSVGSLMGGGLFEWGRVYGNFQVGGALGLYLQDDSEFMNRNITPFEYTRIGTEGIVPIAGLAVNYKALLSQHTYLQLNNILSPVMTNTALSIGYQW